MKYLLSDTASHFPNLVQFSAKKGFGDSTDDRNVFGAGLVDLFDVFVADFVDCVDVVIDDVSDFEERFSDFLVKIVPDFFPDLVSNLLEDRGAKLFASSPISGEVCPC